MKTAEFKELKGAMRAMRFKPGDYQSFDLKGLSGTVCIHMTSEDIGDYEMEYSVDLKPKKEILVNVDKPFLHVVHDIKDDGTTHNVLYMKRKDTDTVGFLWVILVDVHQMRETFNSGGK